MYIKGTGILHHNCEISILAEDWCQLLCHQLLRHDSVKTKDGPSRGNCKKARAEKQRRNRLEASGNSNWQGASWNDFCLVILSSYMLVDGMDEIHLSSWGSKKKNGGLYHCLPAISPTVWTIIFSEVGRPIFCWTRNKIWVLFKLKRWRPSSMCWK